MARAAQAVRKLAHHRYAQEPLVENGVLDRVFGRLQLVRVRVEAVQLDPTSIKVHPDAAGSLEKDGRKPSAEAAEAPPPSFTWLPRMLGRP